MHVSPYVLESTLSCTSFKISRSPSSPIPLERVIITSGGLAGYSADTKIHKSVCKSYIHRIRCQSCRHSRLICMHNRYLHKHLRCVASSLGLALDAYTHREIGRAHV